MNIMLYYLVMYYNIIKLYEVMNINVNVYVILY